jgi:hypothetical protein
VSAAAAAAGGAGPGVLTLGDGLLEPVAALLGRYGLELRRVPAGAPIPGSYWGEPEAGLRDGAVWVRDDTPVHSALHEACHALCMDGARRRGLDRDAGGDYDEENAVCCLQIRLADELGGVGARRLMQDMDRWGYTFRLGSAAAWYAGEADAARDWLCRHGLLDAAGRPTGRARP